jgi:hypothetical protein
MKNLFLIILAFHLSGCFSVLGPTKKPTIPAKPQHQQPAFQTAQQQSADIIDQLADKAVFTGLEPDSMASHTLKEHSEVMTMILGKPVNPVAWEDQEASKEVKNTLKELESEYRELYTEWELALDALRDKDAALMNVTRQKNSLVSWLWFIGIALGILCVLCPTVGVPLVVWLLKRAKTMASEAAKGASSLAKEQFDQISEALHEAKDELEKGGTDAWKRVEEKIHKKTDAETRKHLNKRASFI